MELNRDEILMLIDGLDSLAHSKQSRVVLSSLLNIVTAKDEQEAQKKFEEQEVQNKALQEQTDRLVEDITLLKAKLITEKNKMVG